MNYFLALHVDISKTVWDTNKVTMWVAA